MAIFKAQCSFHYSSALPRDAMVVTPHYFGDSPQALADALKANFIAQLNIGPSVAFDIKIYDAQKAPPSYPLAEAKNGTGFQAYNTPRELALCLSYYSTWNRKSYRGRLYLPIAWIGGAQAERPTTTQQNNALAYKTCFGGGLPAGHNWVVYSRKLNQSFGVNHVWVDDEWDVVRSRGLRGSARVEGTVP
jgi:hypothetical protein